MRLMAASLSCNAGDALGSPCVCKGCQEEDLRSCLGSGSVSLWILQLLSSAPGLHRVLGIGWGEPGVWIMALDVGGFYFVNHVALRSFS